MSTASTQSGYRERGGYHRTLPARPSPGVAYLLWLLCFVGVFGVHRFYTGRWVTGLIWLLTGGLLLIGQIIDLFLIPAQCDEPKY